MKLLGELKRRYFNRGIEKLYQDCVLSRGFMKELLSNMNPDKSIVEESMDRLMPITDVEYWKELQERERVLIQLYIDRVSGADVEQGVYLIKLLEPDYIQMLSVLDAAKNITDMEREQFKMCVWKIYKERVLEGLEFLILLMMDGGM